MIYKIDVWMEGGISGQMIDRHINARLRAKSLHSCPTLGDPMLWSLPGSSVRGASPDNNTGVGCHALPPWDPPHPRTELTVPAVLALQTGSLPAEPPGEYRYINIY